MKVVSCWGSNTNPQYNCEKSRDGGGYLQPFGGCLIELDNGRLVTVLLDDYSAGWFGARYHLVVVCGREVLLNYWSGRLSDKPRTDLKETLGVDFETLHGAAYEAVSFAALKTGYRRGEWVDPTKPYRSWSKEDDTE